MTLTPDQLKAIDRHLRKENWLLNEELIAELTDHYTSGLEDRLATGLPFEQALREVHHGFGGRKGLLNMEETYQRHQAKRLDRLVWTHFQAYFRSHPLLPVLLFAALTAWAEMSAVLYLLATITGIRILQKNPILPSTKNG